VGRLEGKVAFITGAARGQGRSHAVRLAQEGADIIAVDICAQIDTVLYAMPSPADLEQTVKEVEAEGRRCVARQVDVRDVAALRQAFEEGTAELGPVDIVLANAGIGPGGHEPRDQDWEDVIAVNLTGVWNTGRIAIPSMIEQGGAIVLTSSTGGLIGVGTNEAGLLGYTAAKHGVVDLMRSWANYLAPHNVRVNSVAPTGCRTPMAVNDSLADILAANPQLASAMSNAMPVDMVEPIDVSNAIVWLVSDEARYVTGTVIPVDDLAGGERQGRPGDCYRAPLADSCP
jgi:SDR family mycofactocin-dependent oxidoreductase